MKGVGVEGFKHFVSCRLRCFVAREFNAVSMVAKLAVDAFSTSDLGSMKVSNYSQGTTSLLLIMVVEFRYLLGQRHCRALDGY